MSITHLKYLMIDGHGQIFQGLVYRCCVC